METSLSIAQELIEWLKSYTDLKSGRELDTRSFILWLNSRLFEHGHGDGNANEEEMLDMELSFLLVMQNKHYKSYSKKALELSEISSPDSYSFLYHLNLVESYRKMELVKIHLLEAPSGIEVLKRLLKKELIEEFDDPDDKRAKRVRITQKGKNEVLKVTPEMQRVFSKMAAEMSLSEKLHTVSALRRMNDYHMNEQSPH